MYKTHEKSEDEARDILRLPQSKDETAAVNIEPGSRDAKHVASTDLTRTLDDDNFDTVSILRAKLKGYETLGNLFRGEKERNRLLLKEICLLKSLVPGLPDGNSLERLANAHAHEPLGAPPTVSDAQTTTPEDESEVALTGDGHAGRVSISPHPTSDTTRSRESKLTLDLDPQTDPQHQNPNPDDPVAVDQLNPSKNQNQEGSSATTLDPDQTSSDADLVKSHEDDTGNNNPSESNPEPSRGQAVDPEGHLKNMVAMLERESEDVEEEGQPCGEQPSGSMCTQEWVFPEPAASDSEQDSQENPETQTLPADTSRLLALAESTAKNSPKGLYTDLLWASVQLLKQERQEHGKEELIASLKATIVQKDKIINNLRSRMVEDAERPGWCHVIKGEGQNPEDLETCAPRRERPLVSVGSDIKAEVAELTAKLLQTQKEKSEILERASRERGRADNIQTALDQTKTKVEKYKQQRRDLTMQIECLVAENKDYRAKYKRLSPGHDLDMLKEKLDVLKQQVTIYQEDFAQERCAKEKALAEKSAVETKMADVKTSLEYTKQKLTQVEGKVADLEDEKRGILRLKRESDEEIRLFRRQVDLLQSRLRDLEKERRQLQAAMYTPPAFYLQQASKRPWTCKFCTLQNPATATECAACGNKAPVPERPVFTWPDQVQCDVGGVAVAGPPGTGALEPNLSGSPPAVQVDSPPADLDLGSLVRGPPPAGTTSRPRDD